MFTGHADSSLPLAQPRRKRIPLPPLESEKLRARSWPSRRRHAVNYAKTDPRRARHTRIRCRTAYALRKCDCNSHCSHIPRRHRARLLGTMLLLLNGALNTGYKRRAAVRGRHRHAFPYYCTYRVIVMRRTIGGIMRMRSSGWLRIESFSRAFVAYCGCGHLIIVRAGATIKTI